MSCSVCSFVSELAFHGATALFILDSRFDFNVHSFLAHRVRL
jgi:hypothetical protein